VYRKSDQLFRIVIVARGMIDDMRRVLVCVAASLIAAVPLSAHDFWLAALDWQPAPTAKTLTIIGSVGDKFPVASDWAIPAGVDTWRVLGPGGELTVDGNVNSFRQQGKSIATTFAASNPGAYLGLMTVKTRVLAQPADEFNTYLRDEGLQDVIAERARLGQTKVPVRERFARYSKVIVRTGEGAAPYVTAPVGHDGELVPASDPTLLQAGEPLVIQFLVERKPIAGVALAASSEKVQLTAKTDADGRATFALPAPGPWLIHTVYMRRPATPGSPRVDWESYWVTLTFRTAAR
jgi:hypothetical protein